MLKLKFRREQHLLNFMYDKSQSSSNLKKSRTTGVSTRSQSKKMLKVRRPKTEKFRGSIAYVGPKKWYAVPETLQKSSAKPIFKLQLYNRIKDRADRKSVGMDGDANP